MASNHLSFIDSIVIPVTVPRKVVFLAKAEYWEGRSPATWPRRLFFAAFEAVPVQREQQQDAQASLDLARGVVERGDAFGIYPEGTRSRDGRLYRGRTGVGWLALATGARVVPVGVVGTDRVQPDRRQGPAGTPGRGDPVRRAGRPGRLRPPAARPGPAGDHRRRDGPDRGAVRAAAGRRLQRAQLRRLRSAASGRSAAAAGRWCGKDPQRDARDRRALALESIPLPGVSTFPIVTVRSRTVKDSVTTSWVREHRVVVDEATSAGSVRARNRHVRTRRRCWRELAGPVAPDEYPDE